MYWGIEKYLPNLEVICESNILTKEVICEKTPPYETQCKKPLLSRESKNLFSLEGGVKAQRFERQKHKIKKKCHFSLFLRNEWVFSQRELQSLTFLRQKDTNSPKIIFHVMGNNQMDCPGFLDCWISSWQSIE